jgi:LPXTG-motif cell wall-anchored protein
MVEERVEEESGRNTGQIALIALGILLLLVMLFLLLARRRRR